MTPSAITFLHISTDAVPERERVEFTREVYGRRVLRIDIEPEPNEPFRCDLQLRALPGLKMVSGFLSGLRSSRRGDLLGDGGDDVCITLNHGGHVVADHRGQQIVLGPGDVHIGSSAEQIAFTHIKEGLTGLLVPHRTLAALVPGLNDRFGGLLDVHSPATQLLWHYVRALNDAHLSFEPDLSHLAVTHTLDLLALAIGTTRDAREIAGRRGLHAARLYAIKSDIAENLGHAKFSVGTVAARHNLTPRVVQRLFESEGTTFSAFVLEQRLARAYRFLSDARLVDRNISLIAFDSGFSDVSYFNRAFRKRFLASPSEVRGRHRVR